MNQGNTSKQTRPVLGWITLMAGLVAMVLPPGLGALEIRGNATERQVEDLDAAWSEALAAPTLGWVGWTVEAPKGARSGAGDGFCRLVLDRGHQRWTDGGSFAVDTDTMLFFEVGKGRVHEVEVSDTSCAVDARGVRLEIWEGFTTAASFDLMERALLGHADSEQREAGLGAIAAHDDPRADGRLEQAAKTDADEDVRHAAIFWLGEARGAAGYQALRRLEERLSADDLEEALVFAYYVSEEELATDRLLHLARRHPIPAVREQSLFWVAQEAGDRATEALEHAVEDDPDSEVREAAVFGLTQLPYDQGIPALLRVARTHPDPEVREDAFFWLGQSGDPRALELFAEVLGDGR